MKITSAICGQCVVKNGTMVLFHFWSCLFYTIFEGFLGKLFVSIKKTISPLYNMHIITTMSIVFIASKTRVNCTLLKTFD